MRRIILALALLLAPFGAFAQSVQQSGNVTIGHVPYWVTNGVIADGGTASDSPISSLGVTNNGGPGLCVSTGRSTAAGRQQLCLSASLAGAAQITLQNYGTATPQNICFNVNGTQTCVPTGAGGTIPIITTPTINGDLICANGTLGALIDCGKSIGSGTQYGLAYFSTATNLASTGAGTAGQLLIGQTSAGPTWNTLSGDSTINSSGVMVNGKVNGVAYPASPSIGTVPYVSGSNTITYGTAPVTGGGTGAATFTAHGVLVGEGTSAVVATNSSNIGYCLLSQGASSDPSWAVCASGSGTAGGSTTQVQFNNATNLAGSANLTWVSPKLTVGVSGSTGGQIAIGNGSGSGQDVVIQNVSATSTYNFNLPATSGTSGQPLLSGGGGGTGMSFGTLGVGGGGTNCSSASGTCLDNITGFVSTGYMNRTGAGTYTFTPTFGVSNGGTGLSSGTSGGILGFTATGTIASSVLLTQYGVVYGGGAGATPVATAAGATGQVLIGTTSAAPSWSANIALGVSGTAGTAIFGNGTSGTVTLGTVAGALGSVTASLPANSGTIAEINLAQTWSAVQTITQSDLRLLGSSTGYTVLNSGLSSTGNNTLTLPITSADTLAALGTVQTWTAAQTFTNADLLLKGSSSGAMTLEAPAVASTYIMTFPAATDTVAVLGTAQTFTAAQTFTNADLLLKGSSSGAMTLEAPAAASTYIMTFPAATDTVAVLGLADQTLSGGANVTSSNQGTKSSGTFTVDCGASPLQYIVNGGAFTLAAPANDGSCIVRSVNNGSAGAITFSGFTVGSNTGDALTTTNTQAFAIQIWRINSVSRYLISAYQ